MVKVAPSVLSADFARLGEEVRAIDNADADWIHLDVMDGHFVPNITFGAPVISKIRSYSSKPFDVHLMITNPEKFINDFIDAGADIITLHVELGPKVETIIEVIHSFGKRAGLALNPETPLSSVEPYLNIVDMILVMSVRPGFGGQKFMPESLDKIRYLSQKREKHPADFHYIIEVDGGINDHTVALVKEAGVDVVVAGSYIFKQDDYHKAIQSLR